ncbi:hypothetical protein ARMSODRAFT_978522 [Armillaria solidipes]|uniref:Uncharacterized protein n=1 Tax=Armillaria solidipes TaxID=1076256 RepID=A0A2H3BMK7_9AGAR|nr:hypothetical protein ARMSODRAFT_978522 [Armillaria solidipes]
MNTLTSGVASIIYGIVEWFASHDVDGIDDLHITHSLDKGSSQGGFTYGGYVLSIYSEAQMEEFHKIDTLEKLEEQLAAWYEMVFPWKIDSVAVFNEAKARAFSERSSQSEQELRQMDELHRLRLRCLDYWR